MTDWTGSLARAFAKHLEIGGSGGSTGSGHPKVRTINDMARPRIGSKTGPAVVPLVPPTRGGTSGTSAFDQVVPPDVAAKAQPFCQIGAIGTTGTSGTSKFERYASDRASIADEVATYEERATVIEDGTGTGRVPGGGVAG